jgi:hypothetical protein
MRTNGDDDGWNGLCAEVGGEGRQNDLEDVKEEMRAFCHHYY